MAIDPPDSRGKSRQPRTPDTRPRSTPEGTEILPDLQEASEHPGPDPSASSLEEALERERPQQIGPFKIRSVLGWGGMGAVYLADQEAPVRREVAVKIVHASLQTPKALARFDSERQAMARLAHRNVAQIYEAGTTQDGFPYFAMEYVPGATLIDYCNEEQFSLDERLALFIDISLGVQHAHQKGIIHRDIKPSNLLVTEVEGIPTPKVIDFGIAKAVDQPLIDGGDITGLSTIGTPAYMSPEALAGGGSVDTRSDVYALGLVLYELVAGHRPRDGKGQAPLKEDPSVRIPPSLSLAALSLDQANPIASRRSATLSELIARVAGDLDWIVMKALADDPEDRYPSAAALAADLQRHLIDEPVTARPPTLSYRLRKFGRRHRMGVALAATLLAVVTLGALGTSVGFLRARKAESKARFAEQEALAQARRADKEAEAARQVAEFLTNLFDLAEPGLGQNDSVTARELLDRGSERIGTELAEQPIIRGRLLLAVGNVYRKLGLFDSSIPLLDEALALHEANLPDDSIELAKTLALVGGVYRELARYDETEKLLERSLAIFDSVGEARAPARADVLFELASLSQGRGDFKEAEAFFLDALEIHESTLPANSPQIANTLNNLGFLYSETGELEQAAKNHRRSLEIRRTYSDPNHPDIADSLSNLGIVFARRGEIDSAIPYFQEALERREQSLPPDHPDIAISLNNVALTQLEKEDFGAAEANLRRVLEIRRKIMGEDHPLVASPLSNLGHLADRQHRYEEALDFFQRSLAIKESALEPGHVRISTELLHVGETLRKLGDAETAESYLQRALMLLEPVVQPDHLGIANAHHSLGLIRYDRGDALTAEPHLRKAYEILCSIRPADDSEVLRVREDYAAALESLGNSRPVSESISVAANEPRKR